MSESSKTPKDNNDAEPSASADGSAAEAQKSGQPKAGSAKSSKSEEPKAGGSKPDAFKPKSDENDDAGVAATDTDGTVTDGAATDGADTDKTASDDKTASASGDPSDAAGDGDTGQAATDQAATDEAFEAIVDGVEFDPVDGATYAAVVEERDEYLAALQRLKAEFDNHRRRSNEQATTQREQAAASLVEKLLPVLDALDAADAHELEAVRPIRQQFLEALTASGLTRLHPDGESFDPEQHEAVMHEAGDDAEPQVTEVLRTGYAWNGRVIRPAMVKVRG